MTELHERITTRLREDYGVGHVDIEINVEDEITYLSLGRRVAGIGPTLPQRRVALPVTANPAPKASPGDLVQLWELPATETESEREVPVSETAGNTDGNFGDTVLKTVGQSAAEDSTETTSQARPTDLPPSLLDHPDQ